MVLGDFLEIFCSWKIGQASVKSWCRVRYLIVRRVQICDKS